MALSRKTAYSRRLPAHGAQIDVDRRRRAFEPEADRRYDSTASRTHTGTQDVEDPPRGGRESRTSTSPLPSSETSGRLNRLPSVALITSVSLEVQCDSSSRRRPDFRFRQNLQRPCSAP